MDFVEQARPAAIERGRVERGMREDALETLLGEDRAKGGRDRNSALGVESIGEVREKPIHCPTQTLARTHAPRTTMRERKASKAGKFR